MFVSKKNLEKIDSKRRMTAFGGEEAASKWMGKEKRTCLIRIIRPQKDKNLPCCNSTLNSSNDVIKVGYFASTIVKRDPEIPDGQILHLNASDMFQSIHSSSSSWGRYQESTFVLVDSLSWRTCIGCQESHQGSKRLNTAIGKDDCIISK